jgi:hypothetical protein
LAAADADIQIALAVSEFMQTAMNLSPKVRSQLRGWYSWIPLYQVPMVDRFQVQPGYKRYYEVKIIYLYLMSPLTQPAK